MNPETYGFDHIIQYKKTPGPEDELVQRLRSEFDILCQWHQPSKHSFFRKLAEAPQSLARSQAFLKDFYISYQAAMHSTRVMIYFIPHLNTPACRKVKLTILSDYDNLTDGSTRHGQVVRSFQHMGLEVVPPDEMFGDLDRLANQLDDTVGSFIRDVERLFPRSLGAWTFIELVAEDWLYAMAKALSEHFPKITSDPYFKHALERGANNHHSQRILELTGGTVRERPERFDACINDARMMAIALDGLWESFERLLGSNP